MHILLIDDDETHLRTLDESLTARGHRVSRASSGMEGLRLVEAAPPELVISDIQMPGMDGVAILKTFRERFPDVPVILMTGHATVNTAVAALRLGAVDYLQKPIRLAELLACIKRMEENHLSEA